MGQRVPDRILRMAGPYQDGGAVLRAASVDAGAFLQGEWWRVITGLTVHSDPTHLAGNVLSILLLGYAVCLAFGAGIGWTLILGSGIAGNIAACFFHGPDHVSVGASTACFGALGIVSARQAVRYFRHYGLAGGIWSRTWIPLGAGLAVLTMLGTGERSESRRACVRIRRRTSPVRPVHVTRRGPDTRLGAANPPTRLSRRDHERLARGA